jgi:AraC-like DNA-binding protein
VGTASGGINRIKPRLAVTVKRTDGLPENTVSAVWVGGDDTLWLGSRHHGLTAITSRGEKSLVSTASGLAGDEVTALGQNGTGPLWVGTTTGLSRLQGQNIRNFRTSDGLAADHVTALLADPDGYLWLGSSSGVQRFKPTPAGLSPAEPIAACAPNAMVPDTRQGMWIGTADGLFRWSAGRLERHWPAPGQPGCEVLSIHASRAFPGLLWVGTNGDGLLAFANGRMTPLTQKNGLPNLYICALQETPGYLWLASVAGIYRLEIGLLAKALQSPSTNLAPMMINEEDGLTGRESARHIWPASAVDSRGYLYFPTMTGLAVIKPDLAINRQPPMLQFEDILADNRSIRATPDPALPAELHVLEFSFSALSFSAPSKNACRYRLEGYDPQWVNVKAGQRQAVLYYNLKPGRYRFQVTASNNDGVWNPSAAEFAFRIVRRSPLPWLGVLLAMLAVLALAGVAWRRYANRRRVTPPPRPKYLTSALTPERAAEIDKKLQHAFAVDHLFLDPGMTLKKLAGKLLVHPNHLSQIINAQGHGFNDFINRARIEEACRRLLDPQTRERSILDIAYDTGFYSKSVFNTAFKKWTGQTPSQFRSGAGKTARH